MIVARRPNGSFLQWLGQSPTQTVFTKHVLFPDQLLVFHLAPKPSLLVCCQLFSLYYSSEKPFCCLIQHSRLPFLQSCLTQKTYRMEKKNRRKNRSFDGDYLSFLCFTVRILYFNLKVLYCCIPFKQYSPRSKGTSSQSWNFSLI